MRGFVITGIIIYCLGIQVTAQTIEYLWPVQHCHASFYVVPDSINPLKVKFFDQSTGQITSYLWNFGDPSSGTYNTSGLKNPEHIFSATGNYIVCLAIANNDSGFFCTDDTCVTLNIHFNVPCHADFYSVNDTTNPASHTVRFHDISTGEPNHWFWNFGDGSTSDQQSPQHSYSSGGKYTVCLKITHEISGNFCEDSICKEITILRYLKLGGHLFAGPAPINNPVSTGDTGIVYLFKQNGEETILVDSNHFVYLGYYTFLHQEEGAYYIRATLTRNSARYHQYLPTYYGDVTELYKAKVIQLADSDVFNAAIHLRSVNPGIGEDGPAGGRIAGEIFPNPGSMNAFVSIQTFRKETIRLNVISMTGQTLRSQLYGLIPGQNVLTISTGSFPEGIYYIISQLSDGTILKSWKFLKIY